MKIISTFVFLSLITWSFGQDTVRVDTVLVKSGTLKLKALLWHPQEPGKFPTVIFCHGSYETNDTTYDVVKNVSSLGYVFAKRGYIFLGLFRRGVGLSREQGTNTADLMANAFKINGQEGRNKVQLEKLQTDELEDMVAGLDFIRKRSDVDTKRIAVVGHSFGGSLALFLAEREPELRAVILFSAAGYSWDRSASLRSRLIKAVQHLSAPVMIIHAQNDYSLNPGSVLDSALTSMHKRHLVKIYSQFGATNGEAHNLIFLGTDIWQRDVFNFLHSSISH